MIQLAEIVPSREVDRALEPASCNSERQRNDSGIFAEVPLRIVPLPSTKYVREAGCYADSNFYAGTNMTDSPSNDRDSLKESAERIDPASAENPAADPPSSDGNQVQLPPIERPTIVRNIVHAWSAIVDKEVAAYSTMNAFDADESKLAIDALTETAKHARSIFIVQLSLAAYALLTLGSVRDADFYGPSSGVKLPLVGSEVSPGVFFLVAPVLLLAVALYLQIYLGHLARLTRRLSSASLGKDLDRDVLYPWIGTIDQKGTFTGRVVAAVYLILVWWTAPVTIGLYWFRLLPLRATVRDWVFGNGLPSATAVGFVWIVACLLPSVIAHLRRSVGARLDSRALPRFHRGVLTWVATLGVLVLVSFAWQLVVPRVRSPELAGASLSTATHDTHATARTVVGALLPRVRLDLADLRGAELDHADLRGASIEQANLNGARLLFADLSPWGCQIRGDEFSTAEKDLCLREHEGQKSLLRASLFRYADLRGADLSGADLTASNFEGAHLEGADLSYAILRHAELEGAHLEGATLTSADLRYANLRGSHLEGAKLFDTRLERTNFAGAYLRGAEFVRVHIEDGGGKEIVYVPRGFIAFGKSTTGPPLSLLDAHLGKVCAFSGLPADALPKGTRIYGSECYEERLQVLAELVRDASPFADVMAQAPEWIHFVATQLDASSTRTNLQVATDGSVGDAQGDASAAGSPADMTDADANEMGEAGE